MEIKVQKPHLFVFLWTLNTSNSQIQTFLEIEKKRFNPQKFNGVYKKRSNAPSCFDVIYVWKKRYKLFYPDPDNLLN